ncbi:hypothetical protein MAHJHV28_45550 [Mycobacterium avium subsp. hominissuis]
MTVGPASRGSMDSVASYTGSLVFTSERVLATLCGSRTPGMVPLNRRVTAT